MILFCSAGFQPWMEWNYVLNSIYVICCDGTFTVGMSPLYVFIISIYVTDLRSEFYLCNLLWWYVYCWNASSVCVYYVYVWYLNV